MKNANIAIILRDIAFLLEMEEGEDNSNIVFKIRSYKRASDVIANLSSNVEEVYSTNGLKGLMQIPSVGKAIALKIEEYLTTGKIQYLDELKSKTDIDIDGFYGLQGIGPKTIKIVYDKLGIRDLSGLEKAASGGKLRSIHGFSEKKEEAILKKIQLFKKGRSRYLLGEVYPLIKQIETRLLKFNRVKIAVVAGSFRRMKETVGDIDFVVACNDVEKVMDYFVSMPEIDEVLGKGSTKTFVRLNNGMDADLLVVPEESFGSALQYFTGSKEHGVAMRKIALAKGLHLNEWGIFDNSQHRIAGSTEEEVYQTLDLEWIPPEMRENLGEVELAKKGAGGLPKLMEYNDLKGDLQVHSNSTDGTMSIEEMALAANEKFGLQYIAITDHTKSLKLTNGLDEKQLLDQANRIAEVNDRIRRVQDKTERQPIHEVDSSASTRIKKANNFRILSGAEVNIMRDGSLDIANNVLDKLDIVGAAIHSNFSQPIEVQTDRLIKAARNPSVDIIFHPTGRRINKREGYPVNIEKLLDIANDTNTILEIDAHYDRLDLKDEYVRMAIQKGVKLVIDSDAHHPVHFGFLKFGIGQARRGWAEKSNILNTIPVDELLRCLK
ncbi:MAG TPA: helix-hairpin-helix domain-containing protein [Candidatus Nitrosopolaris sp.]|nr:helix-hairpin-helix domain-containing protein [Candidatus Nitrosopolaris sp.]